MGTPEKITLAEKIRLLNEGKELGRHLDIKDLVSILGKVKKIILPLVGLLDKPAPARKRGMLFFSSSFLKIWLECSGRWFISYGIPYYGGEEKIFYVDSQELAKIMIDRQEEFLNLYFRDKNLLTELPFFKDIVLYNAMVLRVLAQFFEDVEKQLQEREEKLRLMKERLHLFDDFTQSLDPLISQGREIPIKEFSIWEDHERGTSRDTGDYLCSEALKPLWEVIDQRSSGRSGYREDICEYDAESLKDVFWRVGCLVDEIKKTGSKDVESLLGTSSDRLPFTEEELNVLKKIVDSIRT